MINNIITAHNACVLEITKGYEKRDDIFILFMVSNMKKDMTHSHIIYSYNKAKEKNPRWLGWKPMKIFALGV